MNKIKGGLADKKKVEDFDREQLKAGIKVEMEHTDDPKIAAEIAMDHLTEDKDYYKKLRTIEKEDRIEVTPDGKQEIDVGKEPLDKEPTKKGLHKKAENIKNIVKKALDNSKAFLDINDDSSEEEEQPPQEEELSEDEQIQNLEEALRDEGYSDTEINYILHGHAPHQPDPDTALSELDHSIKQKHGEIDLQHKGAINDHTIDNQKKIDKLEFDHKKRMLDLEYEYAKKEKEFEFARIRRK